MFIFNYEDSDKVMLFVPAANEKYIGVGDFIGFFETYQLSNMVVKNLEFFIDGVKSCRGMALKEDEFINKVIKISVVVPSSSISNVTELWKKMLKKIFDDYGYDKKDVKELNEPIKPSQPSELVSVATTYGKMITFDEASSAMCDIIPPNQPLKESLKLPVSQKLMVEPKITIDIISKVNSKTIELLKDKDFQNLCKIFFKNSQIIKDFTNYVSDGFVVALDEPEKDLTPEAEQLWQEASGQYRANFPDIDKYKKYYNPEVSSSISLKKMSKMIFNDHFNEKS